MPEVIISRDALTKVKAILNDYRTDISGFSAKLERQSSDISKSAESEMQKITRQIEDTENKIKQLKATIEQLAETISRAVHNKNSAKQKLETAQNQLAVKQSEAASLRERIAQLVAELGAERGNAEQGDSSALRNIMHAGASGATSPSPYWESAIDIALASRGRGRSIPPGAEGSVAPVAQAAWNMGVARSEEFMRATIRQHGGSPTAALQNIQTDIQFIEQLKRQLSQVESEIERLQREIAELEERIAQLQRKIDETHHGKAKKEDELHTTEKLLDRLKNKHERMKTALAKLNDNMNTMLSASQSFETRAVSKTEKSLGGIDKCIAAIDAYLT